MTHTIQIDYSGMPTQQMREEWGRLMAEAINDTFRGRAMHSRLWNIRHSAMCMEFRKRGYRYMDTYGWNKES